MFIDAKTHQTVCPFCEALRDVETVHAVEIIEIEAERFEVPVTYYRCVTCHADFDDAKNPDDPLEKAFAEYRARHGRLPPKGPGVVRYCR